MIELIKIGPEKPLAIRERFLTDLETDQPGVLLNTCNRVEWYHGHGAIPADIARHLFRVVSGLKSSIVGESAVVNQVKNAY